MNPASYMHTCHGHAKEVVTPIANPTESSNRSRQFGLENFGIMIAIIFTTEAPQMTRSPAQVLGLWVGYTKNILRSTINISPRRY